MLLGRRHLLRGARLRLADIRLVERIDLQCCAGDRGRELHRKNSPPSASGFVSTMKTGWFAACRLSAVPRSNCEPDDNTTTKARSPPYSCDAPERLVDDRQHASPVLARAFGDELFDPRAQGCEFRGQQQRQLVAAAQGIGGHERAERQTRIVQSRSTPGGHLARALRQRSHIESQQRGRDETEQRQGGVAAADIGWVQKRLPVPAGGGECHERGVGIRDGDEMTARIARGERLHHRPEVPLERRHLHGRAALAGNQEQRPRRLQALGHPADRLLVGGVEHRERPDPWLRNRDVTKDFGAQADPPMPSRTTSRSPSLSTCFMNETSVS